MPISQFPERPERPDDQVGPEPSNSGPQPASKPRTRLENEVLEILQRTDTPVSMGEHVRRKAAQERRERTARWRSEAASLPARLRLFRGIFGFAVLGLLAYLVGDLSPLLATVLGILAVIVLFLPVFDRVRSGPQPPTAQRWRGRDMNATFRPSGSTASPPWLESLRERFRNGPKR